MKLPPTVAGDYEGRPIYPHRLGNVGAARLLHIHDPESFRSGLCGASLDGFVDNLDGRPRPVCVACRRIAQEGRP